MGNVEEHGVATDVVWAITHSMKLLGSFLLACVILVYPTSAEDSSMPAREAILKRIHVLTGLDALFEVKSVGWARASEANIPFLEKELEGKMAIKVTFKRGRLKLASAAAGEEDKYSDREFVVLLDAKANKLLAVTSRISQKDPNIHPEQSLDKIELEISRSGERYQSLPDVDPKSTFIDALDIISKSFESPLDAQQIDAFYIMHYSKYELGGGHMSKLQYNAPGLGKGAHPLWIITVRGTTPFPDDSPVWRRNFECNLVDAVGGTWLRAGNWPSPKP